MKKTFLFLMMSFQLSAYDFYEISKQNGQEIISNNYYLSKEARNFNKKLYEYSSSGIDQFFNNNSSSVNFYNPYIWYLGANKDLARNTFKIYLSNIVRDLGGPIGTVEQNLQALENYFKANLNFYEEVKKNDVFEGYGSISDWNIKLKLLAHLGNGFVCLGRSLGCSLSLMKSVYITTPVKSVTNRTVGGGNAIAMSKVYKKVFSEERYHQPSLLVALNLIKRVREFHKTNQVNGNIWLDTQKPIAGFLKHEKKATEMAYEILGVYGTRGASFLSNSSEFINQVNSPVFYAVSFLSHVISYLDLHVKTGEESYGYPGLKNDYFYGKHYRFWLPAYISYKLKTSGFSRSAAFDGSYLLALMYEMFASTGARSGKAPFTQNHYSDQANGVRLSTLYTALGSAYGARLNNWNEDLVMISKKFFDSSRKLDNYVTPRSDGKYMQKWLRYYNPFSIKKDLLN